MSIFRQCRRFGLNTLRFATALSFVFNAAPFIVDSIVIPFDYIAQDFSNNTCNEEHTPVRIF